MKAVYNPTKRYDTGRVLRSPCKAKVFEDTVSLERQVQYWTCAGKPLARSRSETSLCPVTVGPSIHASGMINHGYD